jgi:hypothetical protein
LRRVRNSGLVKLTLRGILPDIPTRESLTGRWPFVVVEERIGFLMVVPDGLVVVLGGLDIHRTIDFLLCEFFLSLGKKMSRCLGTIRGS